MKDKDFVKKKWKKKEKNNEREYKSGLNEGFIVMRVVINCWVVKINDVIVYKFVSYVIIKWKSVKYMIKIGFRIVLWLWL